jgi:hypothetical protein
MEVLKKLLAENEILIPAANLELPHKYLNGFTETDYHNSSTSYCSRRQYLPAIC